MDGLWRIQAWMVALLFPAPTPRPAPRCFPAVRVPPLWAAFAFRAPALFPHPISRSSRPCLPARVFTCRIHAPAWNGSTMMG